MATTNHHSDFGNRGARHCGHHGTLSLQTVAVHLRLDEGETSRGQVGLTITGGSGGVCVCVAYLCRGEGVCVSRRRVLEEEERNVPLVT